MNILRVAKYFYRVAIALKDLIRNKAKLIDGDSYFPEKCHLRKGRFQIVLDQIFHILEYSYSNHFYFLYGFDIKGFRNEKDYVDYSIFRRQRDLMNSGNSYSRITVLRDKMLFDLVATMYGFRTPEVLGLVNGKSDFYCYADNTKTEFSSYLMNHNVDAYLKVVDGECADGVYHIVTNDGTVHYAGNDYDVESFVDQLPASVNFILQNKMSHQHPAISAIHDKAVNTVRLVTVIDPAIKNPIVFSAVLRVGVGNNEVDNWAAGGLSIGIDTEARSLREYGFYKPGYGTKETEHPDSHIVFKDYKVPFLGEAIDEAIRFHKLLPGIHSIGWDIAITEEGPCFIEGNDNWEISLMQISNHGLQKEFIRCFYK